MAQSLVTRDFTLEFILHIPVRKWLKVPLPRNGTDDKAGLNHRRPSVMVYDYGCLRRYVCR